MTGRLRLVLGLAMRDLWHERRLAVCSMVGLAAVLAPLIVLFSLKNGVMEGLRADLIENPLGRMIVNASNKPRNEAFMQALRARPDVVFAIPRTRTLNALGRFEQPDRPGTVVLAELLATGPGDPLVGALPADNPLTVIVSTSLAASLGLSPNAPLVLRVPRGDGGNREIMTLRLVVAGVAPSASFDRNGVFMDMRLLLLVDGFIDRALPPNATAADVVITPDRPYAGFRVHARRLEDVITIDNDLRAQGVEVETRADRILGLLSLDRSLTLLFGLIAGLGGVGYLVSLGVGLYANVERKRRELSLLRLIGLLRRDMILFPLAQSACVAVVGSLLAAGTAFAVTLVVNGLDLGQAGSGRAICVLAIEHVALATVATLLGAMLAAIFAGARAARILPSEGLRDA